MSFPEGFSCKVFNEAIVVQAWTIYVNFSLFSHGVFRGDDSNDDSRDDQAQGQGRIRGSVRI